MKTVVDGEDTRLFLNLQNVSDGALNEIMCLHFGDPGICSSSDFYLRFWQFSRNVLTVTNTFREHHQRAIFDNCYLWDICLELWRHVAWPTKTQRKTQIQNKDNANESKIKKSGNMGL